MWKRCLEWSEDKTRIIARLSQDLVGEFDRKELPAQLTLMSAGSLFVEEAEVCRFIDCVGIRDSQAYKGIVIAQKKNAHINVELSNNDLLASITVTGAYGGRGLRGEEIVLALAQAKVTKGINKLALKKVMMVSNQLKPGATFTQPVAVGKPPVKGTDAIFTPLVKDITKRILKPKHGQSSSDKIDLRNLGETISVNVGDELMRRTPATKGTSGFTVQGRVLPAQDGKDTDLKPGRGSEVSQSDPNLLIASTSGTPLIKNKTIEVDNALCLNNVGINTGHIKFKGNLIIGGNIEPGMIVQATGSITVGGFIESANVQALDDVLVGKGIIGHTVSDGQPRSCRVKTKGAIRANYAQYSELSADQDIEIALHSMNNDIICGKNLTVLDASGEHGTLSGGYAKVAKGVLCLQLGVEGDTATKVEAFTNYSLYKERVGSLKEQYKNAQAGIMDVIRRELEYKKRPKLERTEEERAELENLKIQNNRLLEELKLKLDQTEAELELALTENTVVAKEHVFSRVTVQFNNEQVTTKRTHGGCAFQFNQYEINVSASLEQESIIS
nr:FapA family protein [uncultured Vibrio sp.]